MFKSSVLPDTLLLAFLFMTVVQCLNSTQTLPTVDALPNNTCSSFGYNKTDRERSVAQGNYHLMIFCFFLVQERLALHAPEIHSKRDIKCVCVCVFGGKRVVLLYGNKIRRLNRGERDKNLDLKKPHSPLSIITDRVDCIR